MPLLVAVRDLVFRSKIHAAAERLGVPIQLAPRGTPLDEAARGIGRGTLLVDLGEPGAVDGIRAAKQLPGLKVIGFVGHVHEDVMRAAEAAGADEVLSRGELVRRLDALLTEHA